jgi:uncharacterized repeat protein (TIGR03809 family)
MTHLADVTRSRDTAARWCNLAEKRLEHLIDLFESGRWRRYHSEQAFLENIQEAKAAVETWRDLMAREACPDHLLIDIAGLNGWREKMPRHDEVREPSHMVQHEPAPTLIEPLREISDDFLIALESQLLVSDDVPSVTDAPDLVDMPLPPLDLDMMQERYPLLRNAL